MIKLIATDIDGTLVPEGTTSLHLRIIELVGELKKKGILFTAASGRQYDGIYRLFSEVIDDIFVISNNGAYVAQAGKELFEAVMNPQHVRKLVPYIRSLEGCSFTASTGTEGSFVEEGASEEFVDLLVNGYGNKVTLVPDVLEVSAPLIKVAVHRRAGIGPLTDQMSRRWNPYFRMLEAGTCWADFVDYAADKGKALAGIQNRLGIKREETMAFGDNLNDLGLLRQAGESYAIGGAREEVKAEAKYVADTLEHHGVIQVLERLL
ncbi:MAG: HAD family hydrolase [Lachnospiraceae bacterium]|nr:HAD family hydrolase [Lachnospiraceae bacterium]